MTFNEYQKEAFKSSFYEGDLSYKALAINGEAGELAEHVKKMLRDDDGILTNIRREALKKELGDILWYMSMMAKELGISFDDIAVSNLVKIRDRKERGVLRGSGDNR